MAGGDFTPSALGTTKCAAWFDASSLSLSDGAAVASWTSSEGNSISATQTTAANQPTFVAASTISGKPAVNFDGASSFDHLLFTQSSLNVGTSGSLVCCFVGNANDGSTLSFGTITRGSSGSTSIQLLYQNNNANLQISAGSVSDVVSSSNFTEGTTGTAYRSILFGRFDDKLALRYLGNEISDEADASAINLSGTDYAIGSAYFSGGCEGEISEIMYLVDPTQADIEKVEGYTAWKYGLQTKLPDSHTYRFHKPKIDPIVWTGQRGNSLNAAQNWSGGVVPTAKDKVLFNSGGVNATAGSLTAGSVFITDGYTGSIGTSSSARTFTADEVVIGSSNSNVNIQLASNTKAFVTESANGVNLSGSSTNLFVRSKNPTTLALSSSGSMNIDVRHPSGNGGLCSHTSGVPFKTTVGFGGAVERSVAASGDTLEVTGNGSFTHTVGAMPEFIQRGGNIVFNGTSIDGSTCDLIGGVFNINRTTQPVVEMSTIDVYPGGLMDLTGPASGQVDFGVSKVLRSVGGSRLKLGSGRSAAMS